MLDHSPERIWTATPPSSGRARVLLAARLKSNPLVKAQ